MKTIHEKMGVEERSDGITLIDAHHHLWDLTKTTIRGWRPTNQDICGRLSIVNPQLYARGLCS